MLKLVSKLITSTLFPVGAIMVLYGFGIDFTPAQMDLPVSSMPGICIYMYESVEEANILLNRVELLYPH